MAEAAGPVQYEYEYSKFEQWDLGVKAEVKKKMSAEFLKELKDQVTAVRQGLPRPI